VGRPAELGEKIGKGHARARRARRRQRHPTDRGRLPPRPARRPQPRDLSPRPGGGDGSRPVRSHDRGRALSRRDRRLARLRPLALRRSGPRALGDGAAGAAARLARPRRAVPLVGRRHRAPLPGRRHAASRSPTCCSSPTRSRICSSASSRSRPCTARASARTPRGRCSYRGAGPVSERRSGSSG
jgi:hypothetical protein